MSTPAFTTPDRPLTWFITGCSSGIGLSLTRLLLSAKQTVIATSRNPSRTPDLVAEVERAGGQWHQLDVDDLASGKLIDDLEAAGTHIDVLVNNAGYSILAVVEQYTEEEARHLIESLYLGPFRLIRAVVPHMRKRRFGVVVNISAGAGLEGRESMGAYAPAKAALDGLSKVLAKEVAQFNVRVLTVCLGVFNTNMANAFTPATKPLPDDYRGSVAHQTMEFIDSGRFDAVVDGDKEKAVQAIYEVVVGQGVGKGLEAERFLPLGKDAAARVELLREQLGHSLEVFGEVAKNVSVDR